MDRLTDAYRGSCLLAMICRNSWLGGAEDALLVDLAALHNEGAIDAVSLYQASLNLHQAAGDRTSLPARYSLDFLIICSRDETRFEQALGEIESRVEAFVEPSHSNSNGRVR
jgi:hypothetical protein